MAVVVFVILNPEMVQLALFIDAIGLEMFLLLFEMQLLILLVAIRDKLFNPIYIWLRFFGNKRCFIDTWISIGNNPKALILALPSQAAVMHALVLSALTGAVCNMLL